MLENRYGVVVRVDMGAWRLYVPRALRLYNDRSFPPIWICYACAGASVVASLSATRSLSFH